MQHAQPAPPFAPELGGEGLALPASPLAYQRAPVSAPAAGYGAAFAVPEPVMDGVLGSRSAGVEASKLSGCGAAPTRCAVAETLHSGSTMPLLVTCRCTLHQTMPRCAA